MNAAPPLRCAALWAPAGPADDPEYRLTREQKHELANAMPGCPITFEHAGVTEALDKLGAAGKSPANKANVVMGLMGEAKTPGQGYKSPLGIVTDAWVTGTGRGECSMAITSAAAKTLVNKNLIRSVSLTHGETGTGILPVELALCNVPARPGAAIFHTGISPEELAMYKASAAPPPSSTMSQNTSTPTPAAAAPTTDAAGRSTIEAAWGALPTDARQCLADQLRKLVSASADQKARIAELEAANTSLQRVQSGDMDLLERQLQILTAQVDPALLHKMGLSDCARTMKDFKSDNSRLVADAALRTVICASRTLQMRPGSGAVPMEGVAEEQSKRQAMQGAAGGQPEPAAVGIEGLLQSAAPSSAQQQQPGETSEMKESQGALRDALNLAFA